MMSAPASNGAYDEWLDAPSRRARATPLVSRTDTGRSPRRVCPECGSATLSEEALAETGTVETYSVVHVAGPQFADDTPYVNAIADFGPVRLTGFCGD